MGNCTSSTKACKLGLPRGSILGPILFVNYNNDLEHSIKHSKLYMYADDTAITYSGTDIMDVKNKIQGDINSLCKWMDMNQLTINIKKTQYMIIASHHKKYSNIDISVKGQMLTRTQVYKYLGVKLDCNLSIYPWHYSK